MARMIPSVISPEVKSPAEKHIFEWFRNAYGTDDWIVLHSLGISNHNTVMHGEADFFVLVPHMGIFALEVKGGRVTRKDGVWFFTNKYNKTDSKNRGPFDQAWEGIFSIINDINSKLDSEHQHIKKILFGIGVMFPDVEYSTVGCDEEQWQVFDCHDGNDIKSYIDRLFNGVCVRWKTVYGSQVPAEKLPSEDDIRYIANLLRGDFDKALAISPQIRYSEEEFIRLTQEQYRCIDQLDDNKRSLVEGGAGTGKTLIAIEEAKKSVAKGLKTALFCYNSNLGDWLSSYFGHVQEDLRPAYVGTFHHYLSITVKKAGIHLSSPDKKTERQLYYSEELPAAARIASIRLQNEKFDKIIVDESQDLITPNYLNVMETILAGGLSRGRWSFFGDFSQQAIYNPLYDSSKMKEMLEERTSFIRFRLTINCRNTERICNEIIYITGFKAPSTVWSKVSGLPVHYLTYKDSAEEKTKLEETIRLLLDSNISPKTITILSPKRRENSIVSEINKFHLPDYRPGGNNRLSFCTVQGFKGLENSIILLVDIESIKDKQLMYVALSRARSGLYVLETETARQEYLDIQLRRLQENGYQT